MSMIEQTVAPNVSFLKVLAAPFNAIAKAFIFLAENNPRLKKLEALSNMSDEDLAKMGLKREDIVTHVFGTGCY